MQDNRPYHSDGYAPRHSRLPEALLLGGGDQLGAVVAEDLGYPLLVTRDVATPQLQPGRA